MPDTRDPGALNVLEKGERAIVFCSGVISGTCVMIIFVLMVLQVVTRYVLLSPIYWVEEVTIKLMVLVTVCGGVVALKGYLHPRILVLLDHVPSRFRQFVEMFLLIPILVFFVVLTYSSSRYAVTSSFMMMSTLNVSLKWIYYGVMIGSIMAIGMIVLDIVNFLFCRRSYIFTDEDT